MPICIHCAKRIDNKNSKAPHICNECKSNFYLNVKTIGHNKVISFV